MEYFINLVSEHVVSISGGLLVAAITAHLVWRNNRASRVAIASAAFRAAFADALLRLIGSTDASCTIVLNSRDRHLLAIEAFRPYVGWWRRRSFERATKEYYLQANIQSAKEPLEGLVFEGTPEALAQRAALLASIQNLLSHASAT